MDSQLISLFIDDELDFEEKQVFIRSVRDDGRFADETLALLDVERQIRHVPKELTASLPKRSPVCHGRRSFLDSLTDWYRPAAGFAAALLLVALVRPFLPSAEQQLEPIMENHRFVFYHPDTAEAKIVGTFTGWQPVAMQSAGRGGYWSVTLPLPPGEHRYSFLLEEGDAMPDPTVTARELDDFGGENSVIVIGRRHDPLS
ncbi:MAG: hypothetical protein IH612_15910 [Desulfofustis sp.]|nr:hypothetical protein [Desulfofustis sp.]